MATGGFGTGRFGAGRFGARRFGTRRLGTRRFGARRGGPAAAGAAGAALAASATPGQQAAADELVGRDDQLAALDAILAGARGGRGRMTLVAGEPGIGKTRLAEEAAKNVTGLGEKLQILVRRYGA